MLLNLINVYKRAHIFKANFKLDNLVVCHIWIKDIINLIYYCAFILNSFSTKDLKFHSTFLSSSRTFFYYLHSWTTSVFLFLITEEGEKMKWHIFVVTHLSLTDLGTMLYFEIFIYFLIYFIKLRRCMSPVNIFSTTYVLLHGNFKRKSKFVFIHVGKLF